MKTGGKPTTKAVPVERQRWRLATSLEPTQLFEDLLRLPVKLAGPFQPSLRAAGNQSVRRPHLWLCAPHIPKNGTGTRKACCSYRLHTPFQLVYCVKNTIIT